MMIFTSVSLIHLPVLYSVSSNMTNTGNDDTRAASEAIRHSRTVSEVPSSVASSLTAPSDAPSPQAVVPPVQPSKTDVAPLQPSQADVAKPEVPSSQSDTKSGPSNTKSGLAVQFLPAHKKTSDELMLRAKGFVVPEVDRVLQEDYYRLYVDLGRYNESYKREHGESFRSNMTS
jgi:hypothetical protein